MKNYDVIVAGAGPAGCAAAIAAARRGKKVLLFDRNNCPGGAAAECLVTPFMAYWTVVNDERDFLTQGIFTEIREKLDALYTAPNERSFHEEYLKLVLNRMLLEAGVEILYHATLESVEIENGSLKSLTVVNFCGKESFSASAFVDCTGDGALFTLAGCSFHLGREKDSLCQPMTLSFRVANVDYGEFAAEKPRLQELYKEAQAKGEIKNPRENILTFTVPVKGIVHFNSTRVVKLNPTDPWEVTRAEIEAREQAFELFYFLKKNAPSFRNAEFLSTAMRIGVRESRMLDGEYLLTADDLISCRKFEDSIAVANYDIDIHNPEGTGTSHHYFEPGTYYSIPYRSLVPKEIDNLLVAGRCISATHEAQASVRIIPICFSMGQAAGEAACLVVENNAAARAVSVPELQKRLLEGGARIR